MLRNLLLVVLFLSVKSEDDWRDASIYPPSLTTTDFIEKYGYPHETYVVQTRDGYILELHRIPFGKSHDGRNCKGVVFLMHGLESSSADWVVAGPEKSLAFVLADSGYDIWMGNARGNKYSRKHIKLDPNFNSEFWDFSWHEIGVIDLPTMIDRVLAITGENQLIYIGHSQGTTSFFVMASELPQYNHKIKIMHALAPVVFMEHITNNFLLSALPFLDMLSFGLRTFTTGEFLNSNEMMAGFNSFACKDETITHEVCCNAYFVIFGYDPSNLNKTLLTDIAHNIPAGCATKQIVHYGQQARSRKFQKFDYGDMQNFYKYLKVNPPEYNLKKVTAKIALYVGAKDDLGTPKDVEKLAAILPNVVLHYVVPYEGFLHVDFLYAIDIHNLVYKKLLEVFDKFS